MSPTGGSVAIAGATGFVGRALAAALADHHDVVALARRAPDLPGVRNRALDVGDEDATTSALRGCDASLLPRALARHR